MRLYVNGEFAAALHNARPDNYSWRAADFAPGQFNKELADAILWIEDGGRIEGWQEEWAIEESGNESRSIQLGYLDFSTGAVVWRYR